MLRIPHRTSGSLRGAPSTSAIMFRMEDRTQAHAETVWHSLQRLVRELASRRPGWHLVEGRLPDILVRLPLDGDAANAGRQAFTSALQADLESRIDEAIELAAAFRPGHAFCHRCGAASCLHSVPPSSRHVFVSYTPTGSPRWSEFAQYCLDQRHPDVDRLYDDPPAFVTLLHDPGGLRADLLEPFQVDAQELLGQLTAGFFPVPARTGEGRGVLALSIQVTSSRPAGGRRRLGLNILGRTPQGDDLGMLWERQQDLAWRRAVRWAQSALESVGRPRAGRSRQRRGGPSRQELETRVAGILNGLGRRLRQDLRGRSHRTAHAHRHHEAGDRPTRKALDDLREAARSAAPPLVDVRSRALVVLGERGRTHFFTAEGRLVSSVRYSREAIERKRKAGLWRGATEAEAGEFRKRLAGRLEPEAD